MLPLDYVTHLLSKVIINVVAMHCLHYTLPGHSGGTFTGDNLQYDAGEFIILCCADAHYLHHHAAQHGVPNNGSSPEMGQTHNFQNLD